MHFAKVKDIVNIHSAYLKCSKIFIHKSGRINDPLGQTYSCADSGHYFHLKIVLCYKIQTYVCVKIVIATGRDFGSAEWINNNFLLLGPYFGLKYNSDCCKKLSLIIIFSFQVSPGLLIFFTQPFLRVFKHFFLVR